MPVLPCQTIGQCGKKALEYVSEKANYCSKRYTNFFVIILEIVSTALYTFLGSKYNEFWYAFLANNTILLFLYKDYCNRKILRYCQRTIVSQRFLLAFYFVNSFVMSTGLFTGFYYNFVTKLLLTSAFIITLLTLYKPKK